MKPYNINDHLTVTQVTELKSDLKKCRHPKKVIYGLKICSRGCDCWVVRELEKWKCEYETGCKYEENFSLDKTISLVASGYEEPYVVLGLGGKENVTMNEDQMKKLIKDLEKGLLWCQKGYCPGSC